MSNPPCEHLTTRYLLAVRKLTEQTGAAATDLPVLQEFCHDLVAPRRGDHCAARLKIAQERLSWRHEVAMTSRVAPPSAEGEEPNQAQNRYRPN
jgi:hypothetical protein